MRYILAVLFGLSGAIVYLYLAFSYLDQPSFQAAGTVAASMFGIFIGLALLLQIARLKENELGSLASERGTLIVGLFFAVAVGGNSIWTETKPILDAARAGKRITDPALSNSAISNSQNPT